MTFRLSLLVLCTVLLVLVSQSLKATCPPNSSVARTLYWVGGAGSWSDSAHWATSNGGAGGNCPPTQIDDVYFTGNSFSASNDTLYMDVVMPTCRSMQWNGSIPAGITIWNDQRSTDNLAIYGSLKLKSTSNWIYAGSIVFKADSTGNTIQPQGLFLQSLIFDGSGSWSFVNTIDCGTFRIDRGNVYTDNKKLNCCSFYSTTNSARAFYAGTSKITCRDWFLGGSNLIMDGDSATFNLQDLWSYAPATYGKIRMDFSSDYPNSNHYLRFEGTDAIIDTLITQGVVTMYTFDFLVDYALLKREASISAYIEFGTLEVKRDLFSYGSFRADSLLLLTGGHTLLIGANQSVFTNHFLTSASCEKYTAIRCLTSGSTGYINVPSDTVNCSHLILSGITATGGATFNATNSLVVSNVSGWNILSSPVAQTVYWVNGSGNWNNSGHWSNISGGTGGACQPTFLDTVIFDTNSFVSMTDTVNINSSSAFCGNMIWNSGTSAVVVTKTEDEGFHELSIFGNLELENGLSWEYPGTVILAGTGHGKTITTNNVMLRTVNFDGEGSSWALQDSLSCEYLFVNNGKLQTNGHTVNCAYDIEIRDSTDLDTSTVRALYFSNYATPGSFDGDSSMIACSYFDGQGQLYNIVEMGNASSHIFFGDNCTIGSYSCSGDVSFYIADNNIFGSASFLGSAEISGDNAFGTGEFNAQTELSGNISFDTLKLYNPGAELVLDPNGEYTVNHSLLVNSGPSAFISIRSSELGVAAQLNCYQDTVCVDYMLMRDLAVVGPIAFYAGVNSSDLGGNSGINFVACGTPVTNARTLYWVNGSGNWGDSGHWSLVSGGTSGEDAPTYLDDIIFDNNSFVGADDTITLNQAAGECRNMTWAFTGFTPMIYDNTGGPSPRQLSVFGDLTLDTGMIWEYPLPLMLTGSGGKTLVTSNVNIDHVLFDSPASDWFMQDSILCDTFNMVSGSLHTNGHDINCNTKCNIDFSAVVDLSTSTLRAYDFVNAANNSNFSADSAIIHCQNFNGADQSYGTLVLGMVGTAHFIGNSCTVDTLTGLYPVDFYSSGSNTFGVAGFHAGATLASNSQTFGTADFFAGGVRMETDNYFDTLRFTPDGAGYVELGVERSQYIYDALIVNIDPGYYMTFTSTSSGDAFLTCYQEQVCIDQVIMSYINANGPASFYAGSNSVDNGNNTNIIFDDCSSLREMNTAAGDSGNAANNMLNTLQLYPNPANDKTVVTYHTISAGAVIIEFFDVAGRCIFSTQFTTVDVGASMHEISIGDWQNGVYTCRVTQNQHSENTLFIKSD